MVEFLSGAINRNVLDYQIAHMEVSLDFLSTFYILFNDNVEKNAIKGPFDSDPKMVSLLLQLNFWLGNVRVCMKMVICFNRKSGMTNIYKPMIAFLYDRPY